MDEIGLKRLQSNKSSHELRSNSSNIIINGLPKRMLNDVESSVEEALTALVMVNDGLVMLEDEKIVMRRDHINMSGKVKLLSGGAAGHEPAHAGFIGPGMLTAAVYGNIFTSPSSSSILRAVRELGTGHPEGVLIIVKNYIGDRLNFGIALERALSEGINVKMLVIGDDCSLADTKRGSGRRGIAGTIFIHKIAGAMAEQGLHLDEIFSHCSKFTMTDMASIGICLKPAGHPFSTSVKLLENEAELGMGIHNEPGAHKMTMKSCEDIVGSLLDHMFNPSSKIHLILEIGSPIAILINNLGGASKLEEGVFALEVFKQLRQRGFRIVRAYMGTFLTSLDMVGFSITVLKVVKGNILKMLDYPTSASAWPKRFLTEGKSEFDVGQLSVYVPSRCIAPYEENERLRALVQGPKVSSQSAQCISKILIFICDAIISAERQLNMFDIEVGDGDCGTTLRQGAEAIKNSVQTDVINTSLPYAVLESISIILERSMGGLSGALYSVFFAAASKVFLSIPYGEEVEPYMWLCALEAGSAAIARYGQVNSGDRTMFDSLMAASSSMRDAITSQPNEPTEALRRATHAAEGMAMLTATMTPDSRLGFTKSSNVQNPDPGAHAVGIWMRAMYEGVKLMF